MFMSIFNLRGVQTDRFRYEVFQNLFFSPMNTGFLRDTVATVPTVYGIETSIFTILVIIFITKLQQYLPFTVLKHLRQTCPNTTNKSCNSTYRLRY